MGDRRSGVARDSDTQNNNKQTIPLLEETGSANNNIEMEPLLKRRRIDQDHDARQDNNGPKLYCICQQPDDSKPMLQCNECAEWYHYECHGLDEHGIDPKQF